MLCLLKPGTPSKSPTISKNLADASDNDEIEFPNRLTWGSPAATLDEAGVQRWLGQRHDFTRLRLALAAIKAQSFQCRLVTGNE